MPAPLKLALGLALVAFPLLEIALLIRAGQWLGFWPVFLIVLLTAGIGSAVIQRQGFKTIARTMAQIEAGRGALEPMADGLLRVTAGMLLIFPGLICDALGLLLLIPPVRGFIVNSGLPKILTGATVRGQVFEKRFEQRREHSPADPHDPGSITIEGEYERVEETTVPPRKTPRTHQGQ